MTIYLTAFNGGNLWNGTRQSNPPERALLTSAPTSQTVAFDVSSSGATWHVELGGNFNISQYNGSQTTFGQLLDLSSFTTSTITTASMYLGTKMVEQDTFGSGVTVANWVKVIGAVPGNVPLSVENEVFSGPIIATTTTGTNTGDTIYGYAGSVTFYENHSSGKYSDCVVGGTGGVNTVVLSGASSAYTLASSNYVWNDNDQASNLKGFHIKENAPASGTGDLLQISNVQVVKFNDVTLQTKWFSEAQSLGQSNPSQFTTLTEMYIAYFNRAPDAVGLDYWASNMYEGATASQIARNFSASPEALATFGSVSASSSTAELTTFVNGVYQNVLNRIPDVEGIVYWVSELKTGSVAPGDFILAIINAVNSQTGTADKTYITSKTSVGAHFAVADGLTNTTQAKAVMAAFNSTYASSGTTAAIAAANKLSDGYLANVATVPELVVQLVGVNI